MQTHMKNLWNSFRYSYWFVPLVMVALSIVLAFVTTAVDASLPPDIVKRLNWLYSGGADGARILLSTVAGSMITTAGVVFSITIVVLSLTSSQFGPRLLGNFIRDTGTQVALGTFIATFIYCLLVLRVVRNYGNDIFIPSLSVSLAFLLALASTGVLIYFIHHITVSIQADSVISSVYRDLEMVVDNIFPEIQENSDEDPDPVELDSVLPAGFSKEGLPVVASGSGYLQAIDVAGLAELSVSHDVVLRLLFRPGDFIADGAVLAVAWPPSRWDEKFAVHVNGALIRGVHRTNEQDMEFALKQLVEVALRALSPGINDPFTAMSCIDWLSSALARIAKRKFPSSLVYDDEKNLRLVTVPITFDEVVNAAFGQIRQFGCQHLSVTLRLFDAIAVITSQTSLSRRREILEHHAGLIEQSSLERIQVKTDQREVEKRYQRTIQLLRT